MTRKDTVEQFAAAARKVGAEVCETAGVEDAVAYIAAQAGGALVCPEFPSGERCGLAARLRAAGIEVIDAAFRDRAAHAAAGLSGANFAIAATGTVVLESTAEPVRLATTLPVRHFVLVDPAKIVPDSQAAVPILRRLHEQLPQAYLAYITGPSRTADIERVLTIGVHGPKELHILLCDGVSEDLLES
jgi:L-lactate dehydrogenase complex protein LldG